MMQVPSAGTCRTPLQPRHPQRSLLADRFSFKWDLGIRVPAACCSCYKGRTGWNEEEGRKAVFSLIKEGWSRSGKECSSCCGGASREAGYEMDAVLQGPQGAFANARGQTLSSGFSSEESTCKKVLELGVRKGGREEGRREERGKTREERRSREGEVGVLTDRAFAQLPGSWNVFLQP